MTTSPVELRMLNAGETSRTLSSDPEHLNSGFSERRETVFVGAAPQDSRLELLIDDDPLPPAESGNGETRWKWKPGFYAGEVRAELVDASGATRGRFRLEVSPDPNKLGEGRRIFGQMLDDILDFDPALLLGAEPARRSLGAVGETDDPLVQFERLRRRREALERALAAIFRDPASVLRPRRRFVPLREARHVDLETLRSTLRNPPALAATTRRATPNADAANTEPVFDTPAVERRLDSPANRAALAMLRALRRRSEALPPRLEELGKRSSETRTDLTARLPRWKEILGGMERRFRAAERRTPFSEVKRPEITAAGLNAIAGNPLYARFWRLGWEALRRGIHRLDPRDMLPLAPTWEIYERWCFVALAKQLSEWLPDLGWGSRGGTGSDRRRFVGRPGRGRVDAAVTGHLRQPARPAAVPRLVRLPRTPARHPAAAGTERLPQGLPCSRRQIHRRKPRRSGWRHSPRLSGRAAVGHRGETALGDGHPRPERRRSGPSRLASPTRNSSRNTASGWSSCDRARSLLTGYATSLQVVWPPISLDTRLGQTEPRRGRFTNTSGTRRSTRRIRQSPGSRPDQKWSRT